MPGEMAATGDHSRRPGGAVGPRALRGPLGRKTEEAATGLVKIAVRVWGLSSLSLHVLSLVSLCQKSTAFLWSQVNGTERETSPARLASTMRERKEPLQTGAGRYSVGRRGWCLHDSGLCQTLKLRTETRQCKERRLEGHQVVLEYPPSVTGQSFGTGLWLACMGPTLRGCLLTSRPHSHRPQGVQRKTKNTSQAVSYPSLSVLTRVLTLRCTNTMGIPWQWPCA